MFNPIRNTRVGDLQVGQSLLLRGMYFSEIESIVILPNDYRKIFFKEVELSRSYSSPKSLVYSSDTLVAVSYESGWIRVVDQLPLENTMFLGVAKGEVCVVYLYDYKDYKDGVGKWLNNEGVTHWMPLPAPPGGEDVKNKDHQTNKR